MVDKVSRGHFAHLVAGIINGSEIGLYDLRYRVVVESYKSDVFGDADTRLLKGHHTAHGTVVVGHEYAVGQGIHPQDVQGGAYPGFLAQVAYNKVLLLKINMVIRQRLLVALHTVYVYVAAGRCRKVHDAAAALFDKVFRAFVGRPAVVYKDAGVVFMLGHAVKEYHGDILFKEHIEMADIMGLVGQRHQQAVYAVVEHGFGAGHFLIGRFGRLADDEVEALAVGDVFDTRDNGAHKIAVEPGHDDPDGIGALVAQVAGKMIGAVPHFLRQLKDAFFGFLAYNRVILQGPAYGGNGDIQLSGKVIYGDFL